MHLCLILFYPCATIVRIKILPHSVTRVASRRDFALALTFAGPEDKKLYLDRERLLSRLENSIQIPPTDAYTFVLSMRVIQWVAKIEFGELLQTIMTTTNSFLGRSFPRLFGKDCVVPSYF